MVVAQPLSFPCKKYIQVAALYCEIPTLISIKIYTQHNILIDRARVTKKPSLKM